MIALAILASAMSLDLSRGSAVAASQRLESLKRLELPLTANPDTTHSILERLALRWAIGNPKHAGKKIVLDPTQMDAFKPDSTRPVRSPAESAALAKDVGVSVADSSELKICGENTRCRELPEGKVLLRLGYPNIVEDRGSVVLQEYSKGNDGQSGHVLNFQRTGGIWKITGVTGFID